MGPLLRPRRGGSSGGRIPLPPTPASTRPVPLLPRAFATWLLAFCSAAASAAYTAHAAVSAYTLSPSPSHHQHPMIVPPPPPPAVGGPICCSRRRDDARLSSSSSLLLWQGGHQWGRGGFIPPSPVVPSLAQQRRAVGSSSSSSRRGRDGTAMMGGTSGAVPLLGRWWGGAGGSGSSSVRMRGLSRWYASSSSDSAAGGRRSEDEGVVVTAELTRDISSAEGMEAMGAALWEAGVGPGHTVLLYGDLGTGKTTLARGLIKAAAAAAAGGGEEEVQVTSPSYLLDNSYEAFDPEVGQRFTVHHMDLYRIAEGKQDLRILGFPKVLEECLCLIEWPQRLGAFTPATRIEIHLVATGAEARSVRITALGPPGRFGPKGGKGEGGGWAKEIVERLEGEGLV